MWNTAYYTPLSIFLKPLPPPLFPKTNPFPPHHPLLPTPIPPEPANKLPPPFPKTGRHPNPLLPARRHLRPEQTAAEPADLAEFAGQWAEEV